jgi:hemolysin activation/secretion protein
VTVSYQYAAQKANLSVAGSLGYSHNLSGGARNDDATYDASRSGATASWNLWRANLDYRTGAPSQWGYHAVLEGQYTTDALISGEQFGLGGARSVRGFPERESSGDRGWRMTNEVLTPALAEQHRFLGFIDGGRQSRVNALPGEESSEALMSYGLGWRWTLGRSMISALDWARVVNGTPGTRQGHQAVHFSAVWRFI